VRNDVAAKIANAGWGSKSQILTDHMIDMIERRVWQPGAKLPSTRRIAEEYNVSMETVRSAMRELQGRGLIQIRARSGGVVCDAAPTRTAKVQARTIAYVRLLEASTEQSEPSLAGDEFLAGLERCFLDNGLEITLVSGRPEAPQRELQLVARLEQMMPSLAGVIMLRPPEDVRGAVTKLLDDRRVPWLIVGRCAGDDLNNMVFPDFLHMGQMIGRYLAAIGAERVLFVTRELGPSEHHSGIEKMEGLVGGYLQAGRATPVIAPVFCADVQGQTSYVNVRDYLKDSPGPDAIVGYGDRMAMGAIRACREAGLRVPEDVVVLGTTGVRQAAFFDPPLSVAFQQMAILSRTTADLMLQMRTQKLQRIPVTRTPVKLVLRRTTRVTSEVRAALAIELNAGRAVIEDEANP